ncbi:SIS domain-containing protein [Atopobium sp. oral taxon 810]|uniref:SIS domain-containing protein n=1 Tax=Atopobium sp. oral taxon 810 TaxID=712158 RepID=UPI00040658E8|nr:SIS domain-containing protein [Atopobium sp. oral taxon 810]
MLHEQYFDKVISILNQICDSNGASFSSAASAIAQSIRCGGLVYIFGCGHSHILAEEAFFRAGGLANISPILVESLMLHEGAVRSSHLEKRIGYANSFINDVNITSQDTLIVVSTSGRNPVPIDVALRGKKVGSTVIGITSSKYFSIKSRHPSGKLLNQVVDVFIDNFIERGDTTLEIEAQNLRFAPASTIAGCFILNSVFADAIELLAGQDIEVPIFLSGNIDNTEANNMRLIERYSKQIPLLS